MVDQKMVSLDYEPVFESTIIPHQIPIVGPKAKSEESMNEEQIKLLRKIKMLLQCLFVMCTCASGQSVCNYEEWVNQSTSI